MRPEERTAALLWDMRHYAATVLELIDGQTLSKAISRRRRCGSASSVPWRSSAKLPAHVPTDFRERHPEIDWRRIVALRNVIAHGYAGIEHDNLWNIASTSVPQLIQALDALMQEGRPDA
jgi:uncharacterized protein with HEPN domain